VLINCDGGVSEYACGRSATTGGDGTWRDAEDGALSMSAIAQGAVESTIAIPLHLDANGTVTVLYWICGADTEAEVHRLDRQVQEEGAAHLLARAGSHWYTWVNKPGTDLSDLPDEIVDFYRRSLLVIATQVDRGGAVIAANDSDIVWGHNDHYSYLWPRDAAFVCDAMDRAGFPEITRRFLLLANEIIRDDGYFLHKYNPDGSAAPLWHAWVRDGQPVLPIQEDETALVLWLLARHYERTRDLDLLRKVYKRLVLSAGDFLLRFRDPATCLPSPSYDIWEERFGTFTFTAAAVWAGLTAAAELSNLFNDQDRRAAYLKGASEVRDAMRKHLWLDDEGRFARGLVSQGGKLELDTSVDASLFGVFYLGVFPASTNVVEGTMNAVREKLWVRTDHGGVARYENDEYHRISAEAERVPGNPWILCTLWLAEHVIAKASNVDGLQRALDLVRWARAKATTSMILPEQIDPYEGGPLSVAPLTWNHAQVISIVHGYLESLRSLR
jgi:GH15 family glucan-1,4-alpha-glucosidase